MVVVDADLDKQTLPYCPPPLAKVNSHTSQPLDCDDIGVDIFKYISILQTSCAFLLFTDDLQLLN